ncbi:MAG: toll/interleukin-1 receptor domain-containing protein [Thermodesulfobacteriota bacterium]
MKVFISYSTDDISIVHTIAQHVRPHAEVFYWDKSKVPGQESWPIIFTWVDQADIVLALITGKTVSRAMSVGQEIGHAKAKGKTIIPIVSPEVPSSELGFLSGITYQPIERNNPGPALESVKRVILAKKQQIESNQAFLIIGGILALLFITASGE